MDAYEVIDVDDLDYAIALSLQESENSQRPTNNEEEDYKLALELSKQWNCEPPPCPSKKSDNNKAIDDRLELSIVDPCLEVLDPNPDIWSLFSEFDKRFFKGKLVLNGVELSWSTKRMTLTAGVCSWNPKTQHAAIRLSKPLLALRPRSDTVETLLHEMIHAFLFVTRQDDNHESHGNVFHFHMYRINREAGTNITVYHTFHDEVRFFQRHIWRCNGQCRNRRPFYGYVRRASNRPPGPHDPWFRDHQRTCGGTFVKEAGPEKVVAKSKAIGNTRDIRDFISPKKPSDKGRSKEDGCTDDNPRYIDSIVNQKTLEVSTIIESESPSKVSSSVNHNAIWSPARRADVSEFPSSQRLPRKENAVNDIRNWMLPTKRYTPNSFKAVIHTINSTETSGVNNMVSNSTIPFSGKGYVLGAKSYISSFSDRQAFKSFSKDTSSSKEKSEMNESIPKRQKLEDMYSPGPSSAPEKITENNRLPRRQKTKKGQIATTILEVVEEPPLCHENDNFVLDDGQISVSQIRSRPGFQVRNIETIGPSHSKSVSKEPCVIQLE